MKTWQVLALSRSERDAQPSPAISIEHPHDEELERFALEKITPEERFQLESHLRQCQDCRRKVEDASGFAQQLSRLTGLLAPSSERRKAIRYKVRELATLTLCHPPEFVPIQGQIVDASANGLRVRLPRTMHRGAEARIQVENAVVFGTIRYCRSNDEGTYDIGVAIDQLLMRPGSPVAPDTIDENPPRQAQDAEATEERPIEILCIEDNPADVTLLKLILEDLKIRYRLTVASDGEQALKRLLDVGTPKPDLVLLDLSLPKISGLEVLERVRTEHVLRLVPIVILSGSSGRRDLQRTTALGVQAYLHKPEDLTQHDELRRRVGTLMRELIAS